MDSPPSTLSRRSPALRKSGKGNGVLQLLGQHRRLLQHGCNWNCFHQRGVEVLLPISLLGLPWGCGYLFLVRGDEEQDLGGAGRYLQVEESGRFLVEEDKGDAYQG